ncbi:reticulon-like protein B16 [Phalaenopsis equestris]|uniref:reticulon-like protein B16 n=1 Tax=Phalaenopsis equestris TaxID=78828 RepID=UPI0009E1E84E|nr:reticulon-like protein B16 [Phalaenopsis equestris]
MEGSGQDHSVGELSSDTRKDRSADQHSLPATAGGGGGGDHRIFDRQLSINQVIGGGKAADIMLWKRWGLSIVVIVVATVAWLVFERSGLSFLTISSDVLLILIILRFIWANSAGMLNTSLKPLPELVLSEEMVNNAAASFRVRVNNMLLVAHDIAHGKDFRSFFQVVVFLWLLSVMGSFFSFITLAYIGTILLMIVPAIYNKYQEHVDRCAALVHQSFRKHYKIVDENLLRRLPTRRIPRDKID